MAISVCIASRGRPELLRQCVDKLIAGMTLPDTVISVALDTDDPKLDDYQPALEHAKFSIAPREDSLGAKYNRTLQVPADIYVLWADDMVMPDRGWDAALTEVASRLPDQCGAVLFGQIPGILQPGLAVTHKLVEAMGFFCPPYFSYWWSETWTIEQVHMAECFVHADVNVSLLQEVAGHSSNVRDIPFWAKLFDDLRPSRERLAIQMISESGRDEEAKRVLIKAIPEKSMRWKISNSKLRDPVQASQLEAYYRFDNSPPDERYLRLKKAAERMMEEL